MRLLRLEISGFRGFAQTREFDLDADAVVLIGANGHGKTSFFDAILWALSGQVPRLNGGDSDLISIFSETGQARVALSFKDEHTDARYLLTRSFDGTEKRVSLETPQGSLRGHSAEGRLIDLVWSDAAAASEPSAALAAVLTRSVYLQQDLLRQFIAAASPEERFTAVSELVGAGRVTELQDSLERSKKAWTTITNARQDELRPTREKLAIVEARLAEITQRSAESISPIAPEEWNAWWDSLSQLGIGAAKADAASREAPGSISTAVRELDAQRRLREQRLQRLQAVHADFRAQKDRLVPDLQTIQANYHRLAGELEDLKRGVSEEQALLTDQRRLQAELRDRDQQLKALAELALKNLGEVCPVCTQTYDHEATRKRLEQLIAAPGAAGEPSATSSDKLDEFLKSLSQKEKEFAAAGLTVRTAEQALNAHQVAEQTLRKRLDEMDMGQAANPESAITTAIAESESQAQQLATLQKLGESLSLRLARSSASASIEELRREASALRKDIADREKDISARTQTGELAQSVIEALREGASKVVEERLKEINPLLQNIWARIDPHPAFRLVSFLTQRSRGKGQLITVVSDPLEDKKSDIPEMVLSSSQLNALAVSVFLSLNIGVPKPPLPVVMLDDPLQSLDDINLLGLIDLFRRAKEMRQLIVSTHDIRFGGLLSRKLRPGSTSGRTIVIELETWNRLGPTVQTREIQSDPVPLRLVS